MEAAQSTVEDRSMLLAQDIFAGLAAALGVIAAVDLSSRAAAAAVIFAVAAAAICRRWMAFRWFVHSALAWLFLASTRDAFRRPQTTLAATCSVLGALVAVLITSWWWRRGDHFTRRAPKGGSR